MFRRSFAEALASYGHDVEETPDARAALESARRRMPEAVIVDLILPDEPRFDLVHQLRALPGGASLRVIAMSGFDDALDEARGSQAPFDAYLTKPLDGDQLARALGSGQGR